jgi:transposase
VVRFLHHLESRERIRYVAMDMWTSYRDAVRAVIPQAGCYIFRYLSRRTTFYPTVIEGGLENDIL